MKKWTSLTLALFFLITGLLKAQQHTTIKGKVVSISNKPIPGVNVALVGTAWGDATNNHGQYTIRNVEPGIYTLVASFVGYKTQKKEITIENGETYIWNVTLEKSGYKLKSLVVSGKSQLRKIEEKAFNVQAVNTETLGVTTMNLGQTLNKVPGVRMRKSGGLGSAMTVAINGFKGEHVKIFINGVPMENFGSSFRLSNIPISMAERIEVYKGVVPVGLGADAIGGAINIITKKYQGTHINASFSYGSFNTHKSYINAVYVAESGFTTQVTAYRNYSDNSYEAEVNLVNLETGEYYDHRTVERFHDTYHNETVIAKMGVVNTDFADRFIVGITLGQNYDEVQNGARLVSVYGGLHTRGTIIMPSLRYKKEDFLVHNLDFDLSANYNFGYEQVIDTLHRRYNWLAQYKRYSGPGGERSYSMYKYENNNGIVTASFDYQINKRHSLTLSNTFTTFSREGYDVLNPQKKVYSQPKKTKKNVTGLAYQYETENWNSSVFVKHYHQNNEYVQPYNPTGEYGDVAYRHRSSTYNFFGYGFATTYFINKNLQLKASYEKSYRLPSSEELFGNAVTLEGNIHLKPEESNNYNLGISYWFNIGRKQQININTNVFYRDATNFIRPRLNTNQIKQVMDNLGSVTNLGIATEIDYSYSNKLTIGANLTYQNLRNNTKYVNGHKSIVYRDRIPNMPYLYGSAHASYSFYDLWNASNSLSIHYNLLYVHSFYLYWPSLGNENSKFTIPRQISHDIRLTYSHNLSHAGRLQFTLEFLNILDNQLYDNFSLPKPGRSLTAKIRYIF